MGQERVVIMVKVRSPAVAGRFYPQDSLQLSAQIEQMLAVGKSYEGPLCKGLIVPHAGYIYSGPVAAAAYRLLRPRKEIRRVVLLGPAHYVPVRGVAVPSVSFFETPLGSIALDAESIAALLRLPQVVISDEAHAPEHSLEVQLPFLQTVLGEFELIPMLVGFASPEEVAEVLDLVWGGAETLILVSSDLSHFHDYATARQIDADTSRAICNLEIDLVGEQACGCFAVNGLLYAARTRGLNVQPLDLRNSGDTAGDHSRVVGYGAYGLC
jgi:hypothetical protein